MQLRLEDAPGKHKCDRDKATGLLTIMLVAGLYSFDFEPAPNWDGRVDEAVSGVPEHAEGLDAEALRTKLSFYGIELFVPGDDPGFAPEKNLENQKPQPPKEPQVPDYDKLKADLIKGGYSETEDADYIADYLAGFRRTYEKDLAEFKDSTDSLEDRIKDWEQENEQAKARYAEWQADRAAWLKKHHVGEPLVENPVTLDSLSQRNAEAATQTTGSRKRAPKARVEQAPAEQASVTAPRQGSGQAVREVIVRESDEHLETPQELGYTLNKNQWSFAW
ncbi:MAG: hypothetical protein IT461_04395 [Planctomycetes bacterium]|nr:hypothetical protein [Planctomycetota bacterium]